MTQGLKKRVGPIVLAFVLATSRHFTHGGRYIEERASRAKRYVGGACNKKEKQKIMNILEEIKKKEIHSIRAGTPSVNIRHRNCLLEQ